jgi:two-component system, LytTR family, sensor kinase
MKKATPHIIFWLFYWSITSYLNLYWLKNVSDQQGTPAMLARVCIGSLLYILPFIILAYYLVFFALNRIIQTKENIGGNFIIVILPYATAIIAAIVIMRFIVFPYIFKYTVPSDYSLFDPYRIFSLLIQAAFPAAFLMAFSFVKKQIEANEREKNLIKEKLTAELQLLKGQLNPHFLFNTLNNIYALSRKKSDETPQVVLKLSALLSFMLYETGNGTITIAKEIKFLEDYIDLQKIRFADCLDITFTKVVDNTVQPIAPLLLLPLIENAFKHGASENHFDSFIHINLNVEKGRLHLCVKNSFEGASQAGQQRNIGLNSTRRQLELLYSEQKLETTSTAQIFEAVLSVNLNSYGKI